jgi:hypothetical protein
MLCQGAMVQMWGVFRCIGDSLPLRVFTTDCPLKADHYLWVELCNKFIQKGCAVEKNVEKGEFSVKLASGQVHTYYSHAVSIRHDEAANFMPTQ